MILESQFVSVDFFSDVGGEALATLSQQAAWIAYNSRAPHEAASNMDELLRPSHEIGLRRVAECISRLVEMHWALRTNLYEDGSGVLHQAISATGKMKIEIVDSSEALDIENVRVRLRSKRFDRTREWPLRIGISHVDDIVHCIVFVFSHAVMDGYAVRIILNDFLELLSDAGCEMRYEHSSLDQARHENTERQLALQTGLLSGIITTVERAPKSLFGNVSADDEGNQRWHELRERSWSIPRCAYQLAEHTRTSIPAVVLAAYAIEFSNLSGNESFTCSFVVSNRFLREAIDYPGILIQDVPLCVDGATSRADTIIAAAYVAIIEACLAGQYPPRLYKDFLESNALKDLDLPTLNIDVEGIDKTKVVDNLELAMQEPEVTSKPLFDSFHKQIVLEISFQQDYCITRLVHDSFALSPIRARLLLREVSLRISTWSADLLRPGI